MSLSQLIAKNKGFLAQVYGLLVFQILISIAVIEYLRSDQVLFLKIFKNYIQYWWAWLILNIALIFGMAMPIVPVPLRLVFFVLFAVVTGATSIAGFGGISDQAVRAAFFGAMGIFVGMSLIGYIFSAAKIDLGFMGTGLTVALLALLIGFLLVYFLELPKLVTRILVIISVVLFSIFVVYDTNKMLGEHRDVINSATGLYLDIINLFTSLLSLDINQ